MEFHVHSCYFSPLTAEKVAVRLLFLVDQSKHGLGAFVQKQWHQKPKKGLTASNHVCFPPGNPINSPHAAQGH